MELKPFFIFVLPVLTVLMLGMLGTTRRLGFWGTILLSIVLTPVGGFIAANLSGPRRRRRRAH